MVSKIPSYHYMLLMQPSRLKCSSKQLHVLFTCKITTATGQQPKCSKINIFDITCCVHAQRQELLHVSYVSRDRVEKIEFTFSPAVTKVILVANRILCTLPYLQHRLQHYQLSSNQKCTRDQISKYSATWVRN